ncbi:hypothetical protein FOS14_08345 [Skermania sp. ID1734]|uniref:YveK family protein n=1 Tax=Skermania sp. ID1734 TaxID=2597516 RepID=UPI00117C899C|nr:Wzz/FepE/Etk N-terminal domain-containing protein [Skermania sp. ID1734]TSE00417.1 hypothetical protein FOS14_08345 [Skermania sp. ID1734]
MKLAAQTKPAWILIATAILGALGGLVFWLVAPNTYTASTLLFLGSPSSSDSTGAYQGDLFSQQRAATYVQLVTTTDLAAKVIDDLSLKMSPDDLVKEVSAKQLPKTVVVQVSVSDRSATQAAAIADSYATNFSQYVSKLETAPQTDRSNMVVSVVERAHAPSAPSSPQPLIDIGVGVAIGIVSGATLIWLLRRWESTHGSQPMGRRRRTGPNPSSNGAVGSSMYLSR